MTPIHADSGMGALGRRPAASRKNNPQMTPINTDEKQ
jgi:hypothetical protein